MSKAKKRTKRRSEEVWLTPEELGQLEGMHPTTIRVRIRSGRYKQIRKGQRFGDSTRGRVWFVSIYDRAISRQSREKYFVQRLIRETLKVEIKTIHEKIRRRQFMQMTVREFFEYLIEDTLL
jgi:hypothetical protein